MEAFFLPVLSHFQNENFWTASAGRMRYQVTPEEENLAAEVWEGPWGYAFSTVEEKRYFPMTAQGLEELRAWGIAWAEQINARPPRTLEKTLAMRAAALERKQAAQAAEEQE